MEKIDDEQETFEPSLVSCEGMNREGMINTSPPGKHEGTFTHTLGTFYSESKDDKGDKDHV